MREAKKMIKYARITDPRLEKDGPKIIFTGGKNIVTNN